MPHSTNGAVQLSLCVTVLNNFGGYGTVSYTHLDVYKRQYQHEGTYNADGKLTITVTAVTADRDAAHAGANVTLTAQVQVSRTSNLTTPAPQGKIVFSRDGAVIAQAALADAAAGDDGFLTAAPRCV